jgi:uncharacterized membrane protein YccC
MQEDHRTTLIVGKTFDEHAEAISLSLEKARRYLKTAMAGYVYAGYKLKKAQAELSHGEWLPLLEKVGINRMTANRYMRLADDERILEMAKRNTMLHLTQTQFLKMTKLSDDDFFRVVRSDKPAETLKQLESASSTETRPTYAVVKKELTQTRASLEKANRRIAELEEEIRRLRESSAA